VALMLVFFSGGFYFFALGLVWFLCGFFWGFLVGCFCVVWGFVVFGFVGDLIWVFAVRVVLVLGVVLCFECWFWGGCWMVVGVCGDMGCGWGGVICCFVPCVVFLGGCFWFGVGVVLVGRFMLGVGFVCGWLFFGG